MMIAKANSVKGVNIDLRNAVVTDAEFILSLRLDPGKSRFLSTTSSSVEDQVNWLRRYEDSCDQAYFVICDKQGEKLGCVRIYDPDDTSYCWGSWLMVSGLSPLVSIESAVLIYAYGKYLGFESARIDVRKDNVHVWTFHERLCGAERVRETESQYYYRMSAASIDTFLAKFPHLVPKPLVVIPCGG